MSPYLGDGQGAHAELRRDDQSDEIDRRAPAFFGGPPQDRANSVRDRVKLVSRTFSLDRVRPAPALYREGGRGMQRISGHIGLAL